MILQAANILLPSISFITILSENAEVICKSGRYELRQMNLIKCSQEVKELQISQLLAINETSNLSLAIFSSKPALLIYVIYTRNL